MVGLARTEGVIGQQASGVVLPEIIGTPTEHGNTTDPHTGSNFAHTVTADTDLVLFALMMGGNSIAASLSSVTSSADGAFTIDIAAPTGEARATRPGWAFAWLKPTTKGVSHTLTYVTNSMNYSAAIAINIKNVATSPIGASESNTSAVDANSASDSITTDADNSLLLSFGCVQGTDGLPITESFGGTLIDTGASGGGENVLDGAYGFAFEQTTTAGAYNYGFGFSTTDGPGWAAIEVLAP